MAESIEGEKRKDSNFYSLKQHTAYLSTIRSSGSMSSSDTQVDQPTDLGLRGKSEAGVARERPALHTLDTDRLAYHDSSSSDSNPTEAIFAQLQVIRDLQVSLSRTKVL